MAGRKRSSLRLLTGATDGIGLELARLWNGLGECSYVHGRKPIEELDPAIFRPDRYVCADLALPEAPERIAAFLAEQRVGALDQLVLNAGTGWFGPVAEQTDRSILEVVEVDLLAAMRTTQLLLPLLKRTRGRVVFLSSITAQLAVPDFAVYGAAKAAAEGFFRSMRVELEGCVEVQVIRLGAVRTGIHAKSGASPEEIGWKRFPAPADVARRIDGFLSGPPTWRTVGTVNRLVRSAGRNLPRLVDRLARGRSR